MPERQRGEVPETAVSGEPEARIVMWWCHEHGAQMQMVDGEHRPDCAEGCGPMLAVPYVREVAVADAVRAERERVDALVRAATELCVWAEEARGHYGIEECAGPGQASTEWDEIQNGLSDAAANVRAALPPADGNTEEEG